MAVNKKATKKIETLGFVNWSLEGRDGKRLQSSKGFPIFDNPEYPNDQEKFLIKLAQSAGGTIELNLKVRVFACNGEPKAAPKLEDFM